MTNSARVPHPLDSKIAAAIRAQRALAGLSQTGLAEKIGVTFQQVQKYERGSNRVSASRLWAIAEALGVPVTALIEQAPIELRHDNDTKGLVDLARLYFSLQPKHRVLVRDFMRSITGG